MATNYLLNTDDKILTKTLSNRLFQILPHIIDEDQTGYIKGRYIGSNIRLMEAQYYLPKYVIFHVLY